MKIEELDRILQEEDENEPEVSTVKEVDVDDLDTFRLTLGHVRPEVIDRFLKQHFD